MATIYDDFTGNAYGRQEVELGKNLTGTGGTGHAICINNCTDGWVTQSFTTLDKTSHVTSFKANFTTGSNGSAILRCRLYLSDANDKATGPVLGEINYPALSSSFSGTVIFRFPSPVTVNPNTKYAIQITNMTTDSNYYMKIVWAYTGTSYSGGMLNFTNGIHSGYDARPFYVYGFDELPEPQVLIIT